jgi:integrase
MWAGQRGPLTDSGITQVVLAIGEDAGIPGLRPHRLRHTYATRQLPRRRRPRPGPGAPRQASIETATRYFCAGSAEQAAVIDRIFE